MINESILHLFLAWRLRLADKKPGIERDDIAILFTIAQYLMEIKMSQMNLEEPRDFDDDKPGLSFDERLVTMEKTISKMSQDLWQLSLKLHAAEDEVESMKQALTGIFTGRKQ